MRFLGAWAWLGLAACGGAQMRALPQAGNGSDAAMLGGGVVVQLQASRWSYDPETIELQKGVPVTFELRSSDVHHGFNVPGLGIRADVLPDRVTRVQVTPQQTGTFAFHCDYFCGQGHEGMEGQIVVK